MTGLRLFLEHDAQIAARLVRSATFSIALASMPVAYHVAIFQAAKCDQVLTTKSLPYLQYQGHCLMYHWMTYTH